MITDAIIREQGMDIGGITVMPAFNQKPIDALQGLSSVLVEEDPVDQLFRMANGLVMGMLRELGQ